MRITAKPPLATWRIEARDELQDRGPLLDLIHANARRLGTGQLSPSNSIIATGHQAFLWHPGILAKDVAAACAGQHHRAGVLHVVVDQDAHQALGLEVPIQKQGRLTTRVIDLAEYDPGIPGVPTASQGPADTDIVVERLRQVRKDVTQTVGLGIDRVIQAFTDLPVCHTLAQQLTLVLARLRQPYVGLFPVVFASELCRLEVFQGLIDQMLANARRCVGCYNRAVEARPKAGVGTLRVEPDRVELPIWLLRWGQPRQRVFADLADSQAVLTLEDGQVVDRDQGVLAPRALLLTGFLRWRCCDLFIHGRGGDVYDKITEQWWRDWLDVELAPMAMVSADLYLDFQKVDVSTPAQIEQAVWWSHHLPHNIDRVLQLDSELALTKHQLIAQMNDDRDQQRRAAAFEEIHRINRGLAKAHQPVLDQADQKVELAKVGLANREVAMKRDWSFALYGPDRLRELVRAVKTEAEKGD